LSSNASTDPFLISHYNLISRFRSKGGVCAYCNINTSIARLKDLESPNFDVLWLKICLSNFTILLCFYYCSPNSTGFVAFFNSYYLTTCHESLQSGHPHAEILYIGDFNVDHAEWLNSFSTDGGRGGGCSEALSFSHLNDLQQIIKHPTCVPDRLDQAPNTLDLFFTSNPENYSYSLSSPLGSSDHSLLSVSTTLSQLSPFPPTSHRLWHWDRLQWNDLSAFLLDFSWEDCCFHPCITRLAAGQIADIMVAVI